MKGIIRSLCLTLAMVVVSFTVAVLVHEHPPQHVAQSGFASYGWIGGLTSAVMLVMAAVAIEERP